MDEVDTSVSQAAEDHLRIALATRPFVLKIIDLALGYTHTHRRVPHQPFHCGDDLKRQVQALANITTPSIFALIGVVGHELIQQIAIGAMDLDTVEPRDLNSSSSRLSEPFNGIRNVFIAHRLWDPISTLAVIELHLLTFRANGRRPGRLLDKTVGLAQCAGMHDLCDGSGTLRVTAPSVLGQTVIMPLLPALLADNPTLKVDLTLSDSIIDIAGLGIDVAIRIATLRDSTLVATHLAPNPRIVCASPTYLAQWGTPAVLDDLNHHQCIALHGMPYWPFTKNGDAVTYRAHGSFSANSVEAVRTASKQNLGLAMLTYWDIRNELAEGSLALVTLADAVPEQLSITAVLATRQHVPRRVRVFVERLERALNR